MNTYTKSLQEAGALKLLGKPELRGAPIVLMYDVGANRKNASIAEIFAAGAVLTQAGIPLLAFNACTNDSLPDEDLPEVGNVRDLLDMFVKFLLLCWKISWDANPDIRRPDELFDKGKFLIVRSGIQEKERTFFYNCLTVMEDEDVMRIFSSRYRCPSIPSFGQHSLTTLLAGMGYQPFLVCESAYSVLGITSGDPHPGKSAAAMSLLFWAAQKRDPRLDPFRIQGW